MIDFGGRSWWDLWFASRFGTVSEFFIVTSFWWWILIALWHSVTKKGSTCKIFYIWESFVLVFVFKGRVYFCLLELVELFRLYLGASLCILPFLALATFVLPCWDIYVRGSIFFLCFLFQTAYWPMFMSFSLIYVFIVCCLKSRFYFICLYFFSTHTVMHFV